MKRMILALTLTIALGFALFAIDGKAQMHTGYQGGSAGGFHGDWDPAGCGGHMGRGDYGTGPAMVGRGMGRGMMEPGMMRRGWDPSMMGPGYGYGPEYQSPQQPLEKKDARAILENHLKSTRNPNLKLGKIEDQGGFFEAEILTKDDSLVDRIAVDKSTGGLRSMY